VSRWFVQRLQKQGATEAAVCVSVSPTFLTYNFVVTLGGDDESSLGKCNDDERVGGLVKDVRIPEMDTR
jgi:hypothetical protein